MGDSDNFFPHTNLVDIFCEGETGCFVFLELRIGKRRRNNLVLGKLLQP